MSLEPRDATTLTDAMRRRATLSPDTQYFSLFDEVVTYGRLWSQSARYAAGLAAAGVRAGDKVCLIYPTCAEFFYTFFGLLRLGAVPVPLYPTLGIEATANIFRNSEAVAVTTIGWFRQGVDASVALARNVRLVLEPNDLDVDRPLAADHQAAETDLCFLQYTSGSTGHPRGVMLTHANVVATTRFMAEAAGITADDRVVSWLPLYHDMGLIGCAFTPPLTATPIWLLPPDLRNPRPWLETLTKVRATFTVSPDFGYRNCVRNVRDTSEFDLSSLKSALSGAEPVRTSTIEAFESHFGIKRIVSPCYGLAEATLAVAIWPRGVPLRYDTSGHWLSVGQPCPGVAVRIAAPLEDEQDADTPPVLLPADTEGEVCVKSPGVMTGYYNNPRATAHVLSADGWLRTGDLGFVDDEGFLYITGRLKDLIILGGRNLLPADVEEVVDQVAGVRYSAAVGIDSERTGSQRLYVVAEVRDPAAPPDGGWAAITREIVHRVHRAVGHRPARVLVVTPSTIPKTSSGKMQRSRLAELIQAGQLRERLVHGEAD
ncbi:MAG TPA: AMP-binding protein [Methylomirabilota bacterium]|jgi:acyl-CoA synthetase (AMP-forming)/AMP-acid ligase II|nr:AMP-binding protein [Methylomirabilota bacterium]